MGGIFKDCLDKAEDTGLTSISFPAIGTGNLGFPKDVIASLMLDNILEFSSKKQPKHLKKVVIILYSGDAPTIQVRKENRFYSMFSTKLQVTELWGEQILFEQLICQKTIHATAEHSKGFVYLAEEVPYRYKVGYSL